jgi:hypothetical protein
MELNLACLVASMEAMLTMCPLCCFLNFFKHR